MSSWFPTRDSSTWFEASNEQAWIPASSQSVQSNFPVKSYPSSSTPSVKNIKSTKSETSDLYKESKFNRSISPPQTPYPEFFELPSNSASDQNAWNAYVLRKPSQNDDKNVMSAWNNNNNDMTSSSTGSGYESENSQPEKVVFSRLKRNVDIEEELTRQNLYKTELCQSWIQTGNCRYGTKCQFAHGSDELRPVLRHPKYKTEICKTFSTTGHCPYGKRCRFVHQIFELRSDDLPPYSSSSSEMSPLPQEEEELLQRKLQEINFSLAPDPVFPASDPVTASTPVKKGSRLPFLQKLRKQL